MRCNCDRQRRSTSAPACAPSLPRRATVSEHLVFDHQRCFGDR
jgi:hypothetical protein